MALPVVPGSVFGCSQPFSPSLGSTQGPVPVPSPYPELPRGAWACRGPKGSVRGGKRRVLDVRAHFGTDLVRGHGHVVGYSHGKPPRGC